MDSIEQAFQTQLKNIEAKTGRSLEQLYDLIRESGLIKHGQIRDYLKQTLSLGHGDANTLTTFYLKQNAPSSTGASASTVDYMESIYTGAKAALRPIHEELLHEMETFGEFEIAPKKTYVSLRRKKQFAMIGPATNTRIDVGINNKNPTASPRLVAQPTGSMCPYKVSLNDISEIDDELLDLLRQSYMAAE